MINVLMLGPARDVKGGMTSVIDNYYKYGLDKRINMKYIETVNDKSLFLKMLKMVRGYIEFIINIKKYDIVHIHMASRTSTYRKGIYVKYAKKLDKKVIIHIHGAEYKEFYCNECNEKKKKVIKDILNRADKVIVLSEEWREFFKKIVDKKRIEILYNAIIVPEDFKKNLNTKNILFLGQFGKRKGIYDLIDVIEMLKNEYQDIHLYAGGDGEVDKVKTIIDNKKLNKNFTYLGWINGTEKEKILKDSSYYVLPSYNEGMPMSLLEAMAYKNVCISTNVGGIPKVITNKENGILIEPGDKEQLYNSLMEVLNNNELRVKYSQNARKTLEKRFNIYISIEKLLNIYYKLLH